MQFSDRVLIKNLHSTKTRGIAVSFQGKQSLNI